MRLHRLSVTAFGPFGGTQTIDFDRLTRDGLFLLHGATGAGKTSVLDAVCFALYGSVPGARQSGQALRSDLADPLTLTEVVLELTVGERRLEITRLPEQPRPKKRGSGTTKEKAQSRLREFVPAGAGGPADGDGPEGDGGPGRGDEPGGVGHWKALSRSHQEIGEEIGQLLGMSKEQFCQVVLLPQGDFARFLRADAEARARLLGRLFDTRRFAALEEQLTARRKAAADTVTAGDERLLALAHRMAQAAGESADLTDPSVPAPDRAGAAQQGAPARGRGAAAAGGRGRATATATKRATVPGQAGAVEPSGPAASSRAGATEDPAAPGPGEPGFADAVLVRAAVARVSARERLTVADSALHAAEAAERMAAESWEEARERDRLQQRYADARRRAARLEAHAEERAHTRERLERARAAAEVAPALALRDAAWRELDAAQRAERQRRIPLPPDLADAESDRLAALERELREDLGSLGAARRAERRAADIGRERAALDRETRADEQTLLDAAEWLAAWDDAQRAHQQRIETAQEATTRAEQLGARIEPAAERWEAARRRDRLSEEVRSAEAELLAARERSAAAHEHWLDLKDRRLRGIAAEPRGRTA
nr:AAA family ATPase [Streptomyces lydicamycinicus]